MYVFLVVEINIANNKFVFVSKEGGGVVVHTPSKRSHSSVSIVCSYFMNIIDM